MWGVYFQNSRLGKTTQYWNDCAQIRGHLLHLATPRNSSPFSEIADITSVNSYYVRVSTYQRNNGPSIQSVIEMLLTFDWDSGCSGSIQVSNGDPKNSNRHDLIMHLGIWQEEKSSEAGSSEP